MPKNITEPTYQANCWWRWNVSDDGNKPDEIIIYTEQINVKTDVKIMATYEKMLTKKNLKSGLFAFQYKVVDGSPEHKLLFKLLKLSAANEKKMPRKKRETKKKTETQDSTVRRRRTVNV